MKKISTVLIIVLASIFLSGCLQEEKQPKIATQPPIPIKVVIEERTGYFSDVWRTRDAGWYNPYADVTSPPLTLFTETEAGETKERDVVLLLVTEDTNPDIRFYVVNKHSNQYPTELNIFRLSSVPRGYPVGGKRLYQVTITYSLSKFEQGNIISVSNDYYDVDDRSFHIDFDLQKTIGYS